MPTFGERLSHVIATRGLQHKAVAASLGVTPQTLSGWVKSRTIPRPATVARLAKAVGVAPSVLLEAVQTGYEDTVQPTLTSPVLSAEHAAAAAEEAALPMSEAKLRHIGQVRTLTDEEFASIEFDLKRLVSRALAGDLPALEPRRASRTAARR